MNYLIASIRGARTLVTLALLPWTVVAVGCQTTTLEEITPDPSALEKVVAAMNREDWEEADRLLSPILPALPPAERDGVSNR